MTHQSQTTGRYRYATRLNSFKQKPPGRQSISELIAAAAQVPGLTGLELNYPQHVVDNDDLGALTAAHEHGLEISALNMRFDGDQYALGAFTNPEPAIRAATVELCRQAMDVAAKHEIGHVIVWPGPDGFDYPFQVDYARLWDWEVDGFAAVAGWNPDVRVSLEYKPSDPRRYSLVRTMGDALHVVHEVGAANMGVTFDLCHGLMTGESPAAAVAMALRGQKLFGVHLNDGYGHADDGLMVGSVHLDLFLEVLWILRQNDFDGTLYFDTFPERLDPVAECASNIAMTERCWAAIDRIDPGSLKAAQADHDAIAAHRIWTEALLRDG